MNPNAAEILGLEALTWLVGEDEALARFQGLTGIDGPDLRAGAGSPELAVSVFDFLLLNEDLLLKFCETGSTMPKQVHAARNILAGPQY